MYGKLLKPRQSFRITLYIKKFLSMGLRQGTGLCSYSCRKYPGTEGCYMLQTLWNEFDNRGDVCRITKGAHIEHLQGM